MGRIGYPAYPPSWCRVRPPHPSLHVARALRALPARRRISSAPQHRADHDDRRGGPARGWPRSPVDALGSDPVVAEKTAYEVPSTFDARAEAVATKKHGAFNDSFSEFPGESHGFRLAKPKWLPH